MDKYFNGTLTIVVTYQVTEFDRLPSGYLALT